MFFIFNQKKFNRIFRRVISGILAVFISTSIVPPQSVYAQILNLPTPGSMLKISPSFKPAVIKGIKIDPDNPLMFEFLIEPGQVAFDQIQKEEQYTRLIKYFLASLTTPEKDMWVNLSPYEHNRVISSNFGHTEMGRDMLAQDYLLKQLSASLVYPEDELGQRFWSKVYERVRLEQGSTEIPVNTLNKIWIVPQSATIFEKGNVAIITESHLKVMMEQDYEALRRSSVKTLKDDKGGVSQTIREIVLPEIEREINEGKNFIQLRQMYNSMILASWFKQRLKKHLLSKMYVNKGKNKGLQLEDPKENEQIFKRYVQAYKKGVYNYIKEEANPQNGEIVSRKYFSGGTDFASLAISLDRENALLKVTNQLPFDPAMNSADAVRVELVPNGYTKDTRKAVLQEALRSLLETGYPTREIEISLGQENGRAEILTQAIEELMGINQFDPDQARDTIALVAARMPELVGVIYILKQALKPSTDVLLNYIYQIGLKIVIERNEDMTFEEEKRQEIMSLLLHEGILEKEVSEDSDRQRIDIVFKAIEALQAFYQSNNHKPYPVKLEEYNSAVARLEALATYPEKPLDTPVVAESSIPHLKDQMVQLRKESNRLKDQKKELEERIAVEKKELDAVEYQVQEKEDDRRKLKKLQETKDSRDNEQIAELTKRIQSHSDQIKKIKGQIEIIEKRNLEIETDIRAISRKISDLEDSLPSGTPAPQPKKKNSLLSPTQQVRPAVKFDANGRLLSFKKRPTGIWQRHKPRFVAMAAALFGGAFGLWMLPSEGDDVKSKPMVSPPVVTNVTSRVFSPMPPISPSAASSAPKEWSFNNISSSNTFSSNISSSPILIPLTSEPIKAQPVIKKKKASSNRNIQVARPKPKFNKKVTGIDRQEALRRVEESTRGVGRWVLTESELKFKREVQRRAMDREARRIKEAKRNSPKGGIDFDDKYLNMNLEGEGVDFLIPAGFDWVLNTSILGLTPQILEIRSGVGIELSFFKPPYLFKNSI